MDIIELVRRLIFCVTIIVCSSTLQGMAQSRNLKIVNEVPEIVGGSQNHKYYALVATVDGKMYAMQAKESGEANLGRFCVENITDNPSLLDDDNLFYFSEGTKSSGYHVRKLYSKTRGQVKNDDGTKISFTYKNATQKDFYVGNKDGYDGLMLHSDKSGAHLIAMYETTYCKGYASLSSSSYRTYPMFLYEFVEDASGTEKVGTLEIKTTEGYATYFNSKSFVLPAGLKAAIVTNADRESGELTINWNYSEGDVVPAGTAVLVCGENGKTYNLYAASNANGGISTQSTLASGNLLNGSEEDCQTCGTDPNVPYYFYKLSYLTDVSSGEKTLGFYWGATSGGAFTNKANHAYLALKQSDSFKVKGFQLPPFSEVSGISFPLVPRENSEKATTPIYSLDGRCLPVHDMQSLPSGVYVVNGQKWIKK